MTLLTVVHPLSSQWCAPSPPQVDFFEPEDVIPHLATTLDSTLDDLVGGEGDGAAEDLLPRPKPRKSPTILGMESPSKRWDHTEGEQSPAEMSLGRR